MIKVSLFAEQERETKLDKIGDALSKLGEHVDFAALGGDRRGGAPAGRRARWSPAVSDRTDGAGAGGAGLCSTGYAGRVRNFVC
ncbi:hypothetical protein ACPUER_36440 [Burkholderia sp. DN3021]|uniref:hypothetical protein n=1 Tax=Burkholderia sp. DN3021 TaxID=3410137 RepID=UPI003C79C48B